jgi:hypothetical protein
MATWAEIASLSKTELYAGNSSHSRSVLGEASASPVTIRPDMGTIRREGLDLQ